MFRPVPVCLLFYLTVGFTLAQPKLPAGNKPVFSLDSLPAQGIVLNQGWKWHEGDNPDWAKSDYDDRYWHGIDPGQDITELSQIQQIHMGWLRLRLRVDASLAGKISSMLIEQQVASQIY